MRVDMFPFMNTPGTLLSGYKILGEHAGCQENIHLKSRILRPWTSNTPSAPFTSAKAKLSEVSSPEPSGVVSAKE